MLKMSENGNPSYVKNGEESEPVMSKPLSLSTSNKRCSEASGLLQDDEDMEEIIRHRNQDPAWIEERRHYQKIGLTFKTYLNNFNKKMKQSLDYLSTLSSSHRKLLVDYEEHLLNVKKCAEENQNLFLLMVMEESRLFENHDEVYPSKAMKKAPPVPTPFDFDKLNAVLKQIVRDWAEDGQEERNRCYKPILEEVENIFSKTKDTEGLSDIKILVPGAGLGRLAHELVRLGYAVEGNEFSLFMLFASNFLLNKCSGQTYRCFPWIHQSTNVLNKLDQVRPVQFPDIDPGVLPPNSRFSMTAGDFLEVYGTIHQKEKWDCVVTCFFIDCANNIVEYLEKIYYVLKFGGTWINLGPLLYHYADMPDERSIEPPYDILVEVIKKLGFVIEKEDKCVPTLYSDNSRSMLSYTYNSVFLVCTKTTPTSNS